VVYTTGTTAAAGSEEVGQEIGPTVEAVYDRRRSQTASTVDVNCFREMNFGDCGDRSEFGASTRFCLMLESPSEHEDCDIGWDVRSDP